MSHDRETILELSFIDIRQWQWDWKFSEKRRKASGRQNCPEKVSNDTLQCIQG